jgi:predicted MPP superfamily phosphohydrolase
VAGFAYLTGVAILVLFSPRPRDVEITRLEIPIPGLPPAFDGYRILHLSDLHASIYLSVARMRARLAVAAAEPRDLVVFTGDLTGDRPLLAAAAEALAELTAPDGTLAVLGNHDHWLGASEVQAALESRGVKALMNQRVTVERGGERLIFAGVDNSAYAERDDLAAALAGVREGDTVILLSHAPGIILRPLAKRASLILCGHTHGGQIVLPLIGAFYVPSTLGR